MKTERIERSKLEKFINNEFLGLEKVMGGNDTTGQNTTDNPNDDQDNTDGGVCAAGSRGGFAVGGISRA